ncbi:MAG: TRAP transporter small permease [Dehalococcoidales bacterium]|nr:TRAP transporter small permease [Dehalococcoidales bacterium]
MIKKTVFAAWHALEIIAEILEKFGSYILVAMVLLTSTDIMLRKFFNSPLPFSFELTEFLLVIVAWCYIAFTTSKGRHVSVDTVSSHFKSRLRKITVLLGDCITVILFGLIAWQNVVQGFNVLDVGTTTAILHIPKYPFQFWVAFGSALACLIFLFKVLNSLLGGTDK